MNKYYMYLVIAFFSILFVCYSCQEKEDMDVHRVKILLSGDKTLLNESDDDIIIDTWEKMIDKYATMTISERDEFLKTNEGLEFFEVYFEAGCYLCAKADLDATGNLGGMKHLTPEQLVKVHLLNNKYEKNPARFQDLSDKAMESIFGEKDDSEDDYINSSEDDIPYEE